MTQSRTQKVLVIGYGNPARADDDLGPAAVEKIEKHKIDGVTLDAGYQLTVEDAVAVAEHDVVIFIDASINGKEPFYFSRLVPKKQESFSSHSIEPGAVIGLAAELFNVYTDAYVLGIRGYSFAMFKEGITKKALKNLEMAVDFLLSVLYSRSFRESAQ